MTSITEHVFETLEVKEVTPDTLGIVQRYKVSGVWDKRIITLNKGEATRVYHEMGKFIRGES